MFLIDYCLDSRTKCVPLEDYYTLFAREQVVDPSSIWRAGSASEILFNVGRGRFAGSGCFIQAAEGEEKPFVFSAVASFI